MILIDHQVGTTTWAASTPLELLRRNVIIMAKFASGTTIPLVLTSSQETNVNVQGPLMPELADIAPAAFNGKRNFVMAGVTTDFGMAAPAIGALEESYGVHVLCDTLASSTLFAEEVSWHRMEAAGVRPTTANAMISECVNNRATPTGGAAFTLPA